MRCSPVAAELAVEAVDDEIVRVDGDDRPSAGVDGDPREPSVVGAEVEYQAWPARRHRFGHEAILGGERVVCVVATIAVVRPCASRWCFHASSSIDFCRPLSWASITAGPNPARFSSALMSRSASAIEALRSARACSLTWVNTPFCSRPAPCNASAATVGGMPWMLPRSIGWNGMSRSAWRSSGLRNSSQNWR